MMSMSYANFVDFCVIPNCMAIVAYLIGELELKTLLPRFILSTICFGDDT